MNFHLPNQKTTQTRGRKNIEKEKGHTLAMLAFLLLAKPVFHIEAGVII
jgi:hypothetical protein